jgi:hypothetical protein
VATVRKGGLDGPGVAALLDILTEPSPATFVKTVLKVYRDRDLPFEAAWAQAMRSLPRTLEGVEWWRAHFHHEKARWRAAYRREDPAGSTKTASAI